MANSWERENNVNVRDIKIPIYFKLSIYIFLNYFWYMFALIWVFWKFICNNSSRLLQLIIRIKSSIFIIIKFIGKTYYICYFCPTHNTITYNTFMTYKCLFNSKIKISCVKYHVRYQFFLFVVVVDISF